ncbi:uncharacterized protein [Miscanthus floridulus]|uniref:uncharacterized protein n=1 Tax=Miscanthus floridulus TaxID=154761 RepID=UPI00345A645E
MWLRWSQTAINFDQEDHPNRVYHPRRYSLVVSPILGTAHLTKVLMDEDSSLNILYASTLDKMGIPQRNLRPCKAPFYGIVPGKEACAPREPLTFEVIDFLGVYHALLGRSCFTKFMAIPNYTYLKLKMPNPKGVIIVEGSFEQAYYYKQDCITKAATLIAPCAPDGPGHDARRASVEEATKTAAVLDQPSIGKAIKTSGDSGGSAGPSI